MEDQVRAEYDRGEHGLLRKHRKLAVGTPLETRLAQTDQTLKSWLLHMQLARMESEQFCQVSSQESRASKRKRENEERDSRIQKQLRTGIDLVEEGPRSLNRNDFHSWYKMFLV